MSGQRSISVSHTTGLLLVAVAWALLLVMAGSPELVLFTIPVFLLAGPLALGCYPAEDLIEVFRRRRCQADRTCPAGAVGPVRSGFFAAPARLLAPVRGPPSLAG